MRGFRLLAASSLIFAVACAKQGQTSNASNTAAVTAPDPGHTVIEGHTPKLTTDNVDLGPEAPTKPLRLRLWLKLHNPDQLKQVADDVRDPSSSRFQKFLSANEADSFKPTEEEVARVVEYLQSRGLKNVKADEGRMYVEADGTAADANSLFSVDLRRFFVNGQVVTANRLNPQVDNRVADLVSYIGGLANHVRKPMLRRASRLDMGPNPSPNDATPFKAGPTGTLHNTVCFNKAEDHVFSSPNGGPGAEYAGNRFGNPITATAPALPPCGYGPKEIQHAYGIDTLVKKGLDGRGQTIVIVDAYGSPTIAEDAKAFSDSYGLAKLDLTVYQPSGPPVTGTWDTGEQDWAGETTLDVEWAHVMAPGAKIALIESATPSDSDLNAALAYVIQHKLGAIISNSWSGNESQEDDAGLALTEVILQSAVAHGISVHFSSGDDGDLVKSLGYIDVGYPSSSKYVTSIGGTSLALNADGSVQWHSGWGNNAWRVADGASTMQVGADGKNPPMIPPTNLGFEGGAGGGTSRIIPKPSFQKNLEGTGRMQPDISYLADPFTGVEVVETQFDKAGNAQAGNLGLSTIGGTSLACPMFSGMWAIANQAHGKSLGQAAPLLYKLPKSALIDVVPVDSADNVQGVYTDEKGEQKPMTALALGAPQTVAPFYSALYNSPNSPFRWLVLSFGTDSSLFTAKGWDNVTGLGIPNGEKFVDALK